MKAYLSHFGFYKWEYFLILDMRVRLDKCYLCIGPLSILTASGRHFSRVTYKSYGTNWKADRTAKETKFNAPKNDNYKNDKFKYLLLIVCRVSLIVLQGSFTLAVDVNMSLLCLFSFIGSLLNWNNF